MQNSLGQFYESDNSRFYTIFIELAEPVPNRAWPSVGPITRPLAIWPLCVADGALRLGSRPNGAMILKFILSLLIRIQNNTNSSWLNQMVQPIGSNVTLEFRTFVKIPLRMFCPYPVCLLCRECTTRSAYTNVQSDLALQFLRALYI